MTRRTNTDTQAGFLVVGVLLFMTMIMLIGLSLMSYAVAQRTSSVKRTFTANALMVAEAGAEVSLKELNDDSNFVGFAAEQEFFNSETQGRGTYTSSITDVPANSAKIITVTGRVYQKPGHTEPISTRKVRVTVVGTSSEGYSVHAGPGGLILSGSANVTNADVFVNGYIQLSGSARIGSDSKPANVNVANINCPTGNNPGATYPTLCPSSVQPIKISDWSTVAILGTTCATHQTQAKFPMSQWNNNPPQIRPSAAGGSGLVLGCTAPPTSPPTYDKAAQVAAVTTTASGTSNTYVCNSWPFDRTWPANLRLNGNVNVGGSCNIVIRGNTYITGNLTLGGAARITVDESVGTTRPVVLVDGNIDVGGSAQVLANSQGTGVHFISMRSAASCAASCTSLSGNDLYNSQNLQTVNIGGGINMPGIIFQAYWGKLRLGGSGNVGAALGQTVDMSGAGTVTFGTALSSGEATWTITSYQRIYED